MPPPFRSIFFLTLIALCASCAYKKEDASMALQADSRAITASLDAHADTLSIHQFIDLGLYNLAATVLHDYPENFSDSDRIRFVQLFLENGEFDKALDLASHINANAHRLELLHVHLHCALNKRDNRNSRILLDSIIALQPESPGIASQVELQMLEAYHAHNTKDYLEAIRLGEDAVHRIRRHRLDDALLASALHRLGNSYNDIVRDKVNLPIDKNLCFDRGMACYTEELDILQRDARTNHTARALNHITTAMLMRTRHPSPDSIRPIYEQALADLVVSDRNGFLISRNSVYTAIALTQMGEMSYLFDDPASMDSLYATAERLIHLRSLYQVYGNMSIDLLEYYPSRTLEVRIQYEMLKRRAPDSPLRALDLSHRSKYPNKFLKARLAERFGPEYATAVRNWILLHELLVFAEYQLDQGQASHLTETLGSYEEGMAEIMAHKLPPIDSAALSSLQRLCRERNLTIIDLQHITRNPMLITRITAEGMSQEWQVAGQALVGRDLADLQEAIALNDPDCYERLAFRICHKLGLNNVHTPNVIICPDEFLERIPFDALVTRMGGSGNWSAMAWLGDSLHIRLVPSLSTLLYEDANPPSLQVELLSSSRDDAVLPYNHALRQHLKQLGFLSPTSRQRAGILHVIGHTYPSGQKNVEFRLDRDTLTIEDIEYAGRSLAVFHGCRSGEGEILKSEGAISLMRSFLYNGTPAVIHSLWDADNRFSVELFRHFYSHLADGMNTTEALRAAKAEIRGDIRHPEWANPFFWANFQLTGQEQEFGR